MVTCRGGGNLLYSMLLQARNHPWAKNAKWILKSGLQHYRHPGN